MTKSQTNSKAQIIKKSSYDSFDSPWTTTGAGFNKPIGHRESIFQPRSKLSSDLLLNLPKTDSVRRGTQQFQSNSKQFPFYPEIEEQPVSNEDS